jgi:nicotinate dehydrogenase subunit A
MSITLTVNGQAKSVDAHPDAHLLYVLRNDLRLNGAKFGCGTASCGSCTVLADGMPIRSCVTALESVLGKKIETIESLGRDGTLHPVQRAFLSEEAAQCGYCTAGIIMAVVALLRKSAAPSIHEIKEALKGNFCRCGTHPRVIRAVLRAIREPSP